MVKEVYGWRGDESGKGAFWSEQNHQSSEVIKIISCRITAIYKTLVVVEYEVRKRWFGVVLYIVLFRNLYVTLQMKGRFWNKKRHDRGCGVR